MSLPRTQKGNKMLEAKLANCNNCEYEKQCRELPPCIRDAYEQGRAEREEEIIDLIYYFEKTWNKENHKRVPHLAISELVEFIMQNDTKESVKKWIDGK